MQGISDKPRLRAYIKMRIVDVEPFEVALFV